MNKTKDRQRRIWGVFLILFGILGIVEIYTDLSAWTWVTALFVLGAGMLSLYLTARSDWGLLIPTYVLWVVAGFIGLTKAGLLPNQFVVLFVMSTIALPFVVGHLRDRENWGVLIPAYVLFVVGLFVTLTQSGALGQSGVVPFVLTSIALPFVVAFLFNRHEWGYLIPAYVLTAVGVMVWLVIRGTLTDFLIPAYTMFAIAVPFFVAYLVNAKERWPLIPASILTAVGLTFVVSAAYIEYVVPILLIGTGLLILLRQFRGTMAADSKPG